MLVLVAVLILIFILLLVLGIGATTVTCIRLLLLLLLSQRNHCLFLMCAFDSLRCILIRSLWRSFRLLHFFLLFAGTAMRSSLPACLKSITTAILLNLAAQGKNVRRQRWTLTMLHEWTSGDQRASQNSKPLNMPERPPCPDKCPATTCNGTPVIDDNRRMLAHRTGWNLNKTNQELARLKIVSRSELMGHQKKSVVLLFGLAGVSIVIIYRITFYDEINVHTAPTITATTTTTTDYWQLTTTDYWLPSTDYWLRTTNHQRLTTN